VVGQLFGHDFEPAKLASEARFHAQMATEVHLIARHRLTVGSRNKGPLQPDVRDLETRAGVRATVDVDRHRITPVRHPTLKLVREPDCARLRLDDGELAELETGARHHAAPEG